jgi:hypothetical protein
MYQSLRHRCRSLRLNRMPSCFPTALMFGVRGIGPAPDTAFEQAALACTSARHRSHAHCPKESHRGDLRGAGRDLPAARLAQCSDHEMAVRRLVSVALPCRSRATAFMAGLGRAGRPSAPHARGRARETARSDPPDSSLARTTSRNQARPRPHKAPAPAARAAS